MPTEPGSVALNDGRFEKTMQSLFEKIKPEAAYFSTDAGQRAGVIVFDLVSQTDIPWIAEPLFAELHAKLEFSPVMNMDDLMAGLAKAQHPASATAATNGA